ncbi:MAG: hypothetical protein M3498_11285 [Deinococcota bacterium]|jgi:hypothetical protein|nr:hypothetical protein [Deinococcota bacterium]
MLKMLRKYAVDDTYAVARLGATQITDWLNGLGITSNLTNVEDVPEYQSKDVDLIWETQKAVYQVELKVDRLHRTGNFFFETLSNSERGTPGCFLYTEADLFFYYFVTVRELYILPIPGVRDWFLRHQGSPGLLRHSSNRFSERDTTTPVRGGSFYTTRGALIPVRAVLKEVDGVQGPIKLKIKS